MWLRRLPKQNPPGEGVSKVWGSWIGLKTWGYPTPTIDYPWKIFNEVMSLPGCTSGLDELELGSRVCERLCADNCRGFQQSG